MKRKITALILTLALVFSLCGTALATSGSMIGNEVCADGLELSVDIADEGIVLVKNDNDSLPLTPATNEVVRVNVFGTSSIDPFYGGGGSGSIQTAGGVVDFYEALTMAGIEYNAELKAAYEYWYENNEVETTFAGTDGVQSLAMSSAMNAEWNIVDGITDENGEIVDAPMDAEVLANAEAYSENAIVYLARCGSEGADLTEGDLEIRESEAALLAYVTANYDNVTVLFNIGNTMEMGWLEGGSISYKSCTYGTVTYEERPNQCGGGTSMQKVVTTHTYDYETPKTYEIGECDSAMIIWSLGEAGMESVGRVLTGAVSPSGKLPDTIAYDISSNPTSENFGGYDFADFDYDSYNGSIYYQFVVYEEGIYNGYLYYETFAPEQVQYPFGYGLSYTTFEWSDVKYSMGVNEYGEDTIKVDVTVTNTSDTEGKDVVEVYFTAPYYNDSPYAVEKALVNLSGYAKTSVLAPGASETVSVEFDVREMASYSTAAECYVLEAGDYTVAVAADANRAHTAPASTYTWTFEENSLHGANIDYENGNALYRADEVTGYAYSNLFSDGKTDASGIGEVTDGYLHREDVDGIPTVAAGTYPEAPTGEETLDLAKNGWTSYYDIDKNPTTVSNIEDAPEQGVVYYDEFGNVDIYTLQELYADLQTVTTDEEEDALWDHFLAQLTPYEMVYMTYQGGWHQGALWQYGIPATIGNDGPAAIGTASKERLTTEINGTYETGYGVGYPIDVAICSTWNTELAYAMGANLAKEAALLGTDMWWGPGIDVHRNAIGGRNFEYFSEDAYLGGTMSGWVCIGAKDNGLLACAKHFALNEQESPRHGVFTFASEQSIREVYVEQYEIAIKLGGLNSMMTAFNRIGYLWAGANSSLCTDLLRNEWGFEGVLTTDAYGPYEHMVMVNGVLAGNDTYLTGNQSAEVFSPGDTVTGGPTGSMLNHMRSVVNYYKQDPVGMGTALRSTVRNVVNYKMNSLKFLADYEYQTNHYTDINWHGVLTVGDSEAGISAEIREDTITFDVTLSDNEGLGSAMLLFEGIDFTGASVTVGKAYKNANVEYNVIDGALKVIYWDTNPDLTNDVLLTVSLPYSEANIMANGEYEITVTATDVIDRQDFANSLNTEAGTLTIANVYEIGDINGDFRISNADVIMLARYLVDIYEAGSPEAIAVETYGDINGDGTISNIDLIKLARIIVAG